MSTPFLNNSVRLRFVLNDVLSRVLIGYGVTEDFLTNQMNALASTRCLTRVTQEAYNYCALFLTSN